MLTDKALEVAYGRRFDSETQILRGVTAMMEMIWQCDQVRAGQLYNRMMFSTKQEAVDFVQRMQQMEPDQMFSIEAMDVRQVWN